MENKDNKYFPILVEGTLDTIPVCVPLSSAGDIQHYLEMIEWNMKKFNISVDLKIYQNGSEIGSMQNTSKDNLQ